MRQVLPPCCYHTHNMSHRHISIRSIRNNGLLSYCYRTTAPRRIKVQPVAAHESQPSSVVMSTRSAVRS